MFRVWSFSLLKQSPFIDTSTNDVTAEAATQHLHYAPLTVTVDEWRISMMGAKESRILDCPNKGFEKQGSGYTVKIKISKHEDQHSLPGMTLDVQACILFADLVISNFVFRPMCSQLPP